MKEKLVIGFEMLEGSGEQIVLDLVAGMLARRFRIVPEVADSEGLVYEVENCREAAALVEEYLKMVEKTVRVRFEGWVRVRLPDMVECRQ